MASRLLHLRRLLPSRPTVPAAAFSTAVTPTPRVSTLVDEICGLTLLEASTLADALRGRLGVDQLPPLAILSGGAAPFAGGGAVPGAAGEESKAKEEKMAFDVKLEGFDAAAKLKIIKELRGFTNLGLKEAKELVEKAPAVLKAGVPKRTDPATLRGGELGLGCAPASSSSHAHGIPALIIASSPRFHSAAASVLLLRSRCCRPFHRRFILQNDCLASKPNIHLKVLC